MMMKKDLQPGIRGLCWSDEGQVIIFSYMRKATSYSVVVWRSFLLSVLVVSTRASASLSLGVPHTLAESPEGSFLPGNSCLPVLQHGRLCVFVYLCPKENVRGLNVTGRRICEGGQ